jgi:hypothetical protein
LTACRADDDCNCILNCLLEGDNNLPQCQQMCGGGGGNINQAFMMLRQCQNNECGQACG